MTSTAAFLTEGSIEFFILRKKKKTNTYVSRAYAVQKEDEGEKVFGHNRSNNYIVVCY